MASYYDLLAEWYDDFLGPGNSHIYNGDTDFYLEEIKKTGAPVLDVGCGTGRVTIPIAEAGYQVTGLDISERMVEAARRKSKTSKVKEGMLSLEVADMRNFKIDGGFPLIIVSGGSFVFMETVEDQKRALVNFRQHLSDDGELILDFCLIHPDMDSKLRFMFSFSDNGKPYMMWKSAHWNSYEQIQSYPTIIDEIDANGEVFKRQYYEQRMRLTHRYEAEHLFEIYGFKVVDLFGNWKRQPFDAQSRIMIWILRKQ